MSDNLQSLIKLLIIEDDPKIIEHVSNELVKKVIALSTPYKL